MRVLVILVSRHTSLLRLFEKRSLQILDKARMPEQIAERIELYSRTFNPEQNSRLSLTQLILNEASSELGSSLDGIVILCEKPFEQGLAEIRNAIFSAVIPAITYVENINNLLTGHFRVLLGNYGHLIDLTDSATYRQAASLPIRNFHATELQQLTEICSNESLSKTFKNKITPCLNKLVSRRGPNRRSNYPSVYFRDDSKRNFQYGHEHHSRYETGGQHTNVCVIHGMFRFGRALSEQRHFNVTAGSASSRQRITCALPNCHEQIISVCNRTHINMFSNDFHK